MAKRIAVGGENFETIRKSDSYYVDKTELLYELIQETNNTVTLFTRPRRFGKTLTLSMMESFFSITKKDSADLFRDLKIMDHPEFCTEYRNQYPVLFLSLKDVEGLDFETAYDKLKIVLADLCKKFEYLGKEMAVNPADAEIFSRLMFNTASAAEVQNALKTIMRMMNAVEGKPVILLIDEYDVPLAKAHHNGFYKQMLDVIRGLMSTSLKTNEYLKFAVVTGCLRIPKESIFTGVNNFASYSVLEGRFSKYFGFTQDEVEKLLATFGLFNKAEAARAWYDGYVFGDTEIYCPWDVVSYVSDLLYKNNSKPRNYWKNTSGNDAIKEFFGRPDIDVSRKFETLLNGGTIMETISDELTYDKAYESESNLWSILLMTGYLTIIQQEDVEEEETRRQVELKIPNREIAAIFQETVVNYFTKSIDQTRLQALMNALWEGDEPAASRILSDLLWHTISYMDYHEDYYHAFLAGLFVGRGYEVQSNKEKGTGRPDIQLIDNRNRRVIIMETKKSKQENDMPADCCKALRQIIERQYAVNFNGYTQVMCYGIAFFQKSALVKRSDAE